MRILTSIMSVRNYKTTGLWTSSNDILTSKHIHDSSLFRRLLLVACSIIALSELSLVPVRGATIFVPDHVATIQQAINVAAKGDIIIVRPGTYRENIDYRGKAIVVRSEQGPSFTMIDGGKVGSVVSFRNKENRESVLNGFTLENGQNNWAGGVFCWRSSPTIINNVIQNNHASYGGGGIDCSGGLEASPYLAGNYICDNSAGSGGGISCSDGCLPLLVGNTISDNNASNSGGGLLAEHSSPVLRRNSILRNTASSNGGGINSYDSKLSLFENQIAYNSAVRCGGGIQIDCSTLVAGRNTISSNRSESMHGGGIAISNSRATIENNTINGNSAGNFGGGISGQYNLMLSIENNTICENISLCGGAIHLFGEYCAAITSNVLARNQAERGGGIACYRTDEVLIVNSIITENKADLLGGAIFCEDGTSLVVMCDTIYRNSASSKGGGIHCRDTCSLVIANSILWNNSAPEGPEMRIGTSMLPSVVSVCFSDISGGQSSVYVASHCTLNWGSGMLDAEPRFVDAIHSDLHIKFDSPCRDTGHDPIPYLPVVDMEGDPRKAHGRVDMGADEFHSHLYATGSVVPSGSLEIKVVGLPYTAPVTLALGSGIREPPWPTPYGGFYLRRPIIRRIQLGSIPPDGVLIHQGLVPSSWQSGEERPFQALLGLPAPGSELTNLMVLEVDGRDDESNSR